MSARLRTFVLDRHDGFWELLATAAGHPVAIAKSERGLSAEALGQCFNGPAGSPSIVQARVEAIAAFNVGVLAELAGTWRSPKGLTADFDDVANDFWASAWCSALRHLSRIGAVERA